MDDVITLSSDEESDIPTKKRKLNSGAENFIKTDKTFIDKADRLEEISVIKKTNNVTIVNHKGTETIIVDSTEVTDACNGSKSSTLTGSANTTIEILDVQDSPKKNCTILDENPINKVDNNNDENQKDEEVRDYFNLGLITNNESNKTESKDPLDNSQLDCTNHNSNGTVNGDIDDNQPSTSKTPNQSILDAFLEICTNSIRTSTYESRLSDRYDKIKNMYTKCDNIDNDEEFLRIIDNNKNNAKKSPADAVLAFREVYGYVHDYVKSIVIEIPEENLEKVEKLEESMKNLLKKLKHLETLEVDISKDDEDSNYVKMERYAARLDKVYKKYCQLTNTDPYNGRLLYQKINLTTSKYNEINKAVVKSYKRNKFPSYYDVEMTVRKCIEKHKLQLTENEILNESKKCFKKLGAILQSRRQQELHDNLSVFMGNQDPAIDDTELDNRLKQNLEEGEKKIQDLIEKYAKMEETNKDGKVSEDSDDSDSEQQDDDDDDVDDNNEGDGINAENGKN